jgi:hypothetical protein
MTRPTLTFDEVAATRWGRLKLWLHCRVLYPLLWLLPYEWRWGVVKASRRRIFGPNANYEDLHALLDRATERVSS